MPNEDDNVHLSDLLSRKLDRSEFERRDHRRVIYEIHYRVPRELSALFGATHFTQNRRSKEDIYYALAEKSFRQLFDSTAFRSQLAQRHSVFSSIFEADNKKLIQLYNLYKQKTDKKGQASQTEFMSKAVNCIDMIRIKYDHVLDNSTALFVFGAREHIIDEIFQYVTAEMGACDILDIVFSDFSVTLSAAFAVLFHQIYKQLEIDLHEVNSLENHHFEFRSCEYGGLIAQIEKQADPSRAQVPQNVFDDFKHIYIDPHNLTEKLKSKLDYQLRWSRYPQAWNYTFIESFFPKQTRSPITARLTENEIDMIKDFIICSVLRPMVPQAAAFDKVPKNMDFPGYTLAGAHYLMLPIEHLLLVTLSPLNHPEEKSMAADRINKSILKVRTVAGDDENLIKDIDNLIERFDDKRAERMSFLTALILKCFTILESVDINNALKSHSVDPKYYQPTDDVNLTKKESPSLVDLLSPDRSLSFEEINNRLNALALQSASPNDIVNFCNVLGGIVRRAIRSSSISGGVRSAILECVANVTRVFWDSTFAVNTRPELGLVSTDYVCSSMVDNRCVYFSNFLPFGGDKFTRTIFVDLGMDANQRARMLQRLCDILTYRSNPLRDLDRVKAAIAALTEFNRKLNDIQIRLSGHVGQDVEGDLSSQDWKERICRLHKELDDITKISAQTGRLNAFITYGVAGKWHSFDAYFRQILERTGDVREEGIPGFARLSDFVERRLANSARFVERMNIHHLSVGSRITDLMDLVRTQLQALQSREIVANLAIQTAAATTLKDASGGLKGAAEGIDRNIAELYSLQKAADVLVLFGGTYYCYQLLKVVIPTRWLLNTIAWIDEYVFKELIGVSIKIQDAEYSVGIIVAATALAITVLARFAGHKLFGHGRKGKEAGTGT